MWSFMTGFFSLAVDPVFKVHLLVLSDPVTLLWTVAGQAPRCVGFSGQESSAGLLLPPPPLCVCATFIYPFSWWTFGFFLSGSYEQCLCGHLSTGRLVDTHFCLP